MNQMTATDLKTQLPEGSIKKIAAFLDYSTDYVGKVIRGERTNKFVLTAIYTLIAKQYKLKESLDKIIEAVTNDAPMTNITKKEDNPENPQKESELLTDSVCDSPLV